MDDLHRVVKTVHPVIRLNILDKHTKKMFTVPYFAGEDFVLERIPRRIIDIFSPNRKYVYSNVVNNNKYTQAYYLNKKLITNMDLGSTTLLLKLNGCNTLIGQRFKRKVSIEGSLLINDLLKEFTIYQNPDNIYEIYNNSNRSLVIRRLSTLNMINTLLTSNVKIDVNKFEDLLIDVINTDKGLLSVNMMKRKIKKELGVKICSVC